jgi:cell division protein FtsB
MLDFREKKKIRKAIYSKPVIVLLVVVLAVCVRSTWGLFAKYSEATKKADEAKAELVKLEQQKMELEKRVDFLQTERGREEEIRNKFMVAKEGESVIMVVDPKPATETPEVVSKPNMWGRFLNFFR